MANKIANMIIRCHQLNEGKHSSSSGFAIELQPVTQDDNRAVLELDELGVGDVAGTTGVLKSGSLYWSF